MRLIEYVSEIIESEDYVALHCALYDDLRKVMFAHVEHFNPDFINMESEVKLLLSNANVTIICVKTLCDILTRRRSILYENH